MSSEVAVVWHSETASWKWRIAIGASLLLAGLVLSFTAPPRFYTPLVVGSWLLFDALEDWRFGSSILGARAKHKWRAFAALYAGFGILGFVSDFVLGLSVSNLWHYPSYDSPILHANLYLVVYPVGGLFTYSLLRFIAGPRNLTASTIPRRSLLYAAGFGTVALGSILLWSWLAGEIQNAWYRVAAFGLVFAGEILILELVAHARGTQGAMTRLQSNPRILAPLLVASAVGALLHELPNLNLHEWEYRNLPIDATFLGIPLAVLAGWPMLLAAPWAMANALQKAGRDPFLVREGS